jgi:hypothetical protein
VGWSLAPILARAGAVQLKMRDNHRRGFPVLVDPEKDRNAAAEIAAVHNPAERHARIPFDSVLTKSTD